MIRVSKCGQLSQQTRRLDQMLFQCSSSAVGGGPILKQHWVKCSRLLGSTQVSVYTHPSATIIFSPADQGTFSKTAGQSQAYYNTWNWERGTYDVNHLHISTCEGAVSRVSSVVRLLRMSKNQELQMFGLKLTKYKKKKNINLDRNSLELIRSMLSSSSGARPFYIDLTKQHASGEMIGHKRPDF